MLAFQVEMLRRVWNVPPTHIDREWTTRNVLNELHLPGQHQHVKLSDKKPAQKCTRRAPLRKTQRNKYSTL